MGLLGPNGAGKTTCLRLLSGTLAPSGGRVEILGIDLARRPLEAKRHLGYLPERPPLYPELRVDEYLRHCARLHRIPRADVAEAMDRAKQRCGLDAVGRTLIAKLSKGFRQRLGIAQAILHRPKLLILDEPTEGLDPVQMRELRGLIRELSRDCGIILSSHILSEVQAVCDRVAGAPSGPDPAQRSARRDQPDRDLAGAPAPAGRVRRVCADGAPRAPAPAWRPRSRSATTDIRVILTEEADSADLARQILPAGLGLRELVPERPDLERVFFDLIGAGGTA